MLLRNRQTHSHLGQSCSHCTSSALPMTARTDNCIYNKYIKFDIKTISYEHKHASLHRQLQLQYGCLYPTKAIHQRNYKVIKLILHCSQDNI